MLVPGASLPRGGSPELRHLTRLVPALALQVFDLAIPTPLDECAGLAADEAEQLDRRA